MAKLHDAVVGNRIDEARTLLDRGVDPNQLVKDSSVLAWAVYKGFEPIVKLLLERGANPNLGTSYPCAGGAMHAVASKQEKSAFRTPPSSSSRARMLAMLLEHGGDPNAAGQHDGRPLATAVACKDVAMVRALLAAGARPELEDRGGKSAWDAAIRIDDPEIFELIAATDPARVTRDGKRLLHDAAWYGAKLIDLLVERGVPVDTEALHIAVVRDNAKAVAGLLARGADPQAKIEGKAALDVAKQHGSTKAARLLKR